MPGPKKIINDRGTRTELADECTMKLAEAAYHAEQLANLLNELVPNQGDHWAEMANKLQELLFKCRKFAV